MLPDNDTLMAAQSYQGNTVGWGPRPGAEVDEYANVVSIEPYLRVRPWWKRIDWLIVLAAIGLVPYVVADLHAIAPIVGGMFLGIRAAQRWL
jgi:hypothetical protein